MEALATVVDESSVIFSDAIEPTAFAPSSDEMDVIDPASYVSSPKSVNSTPKPNFTFDRNGPSRKMRSLSPCLHLQMAPKLDSSIPSMPGPQNESIVLILLDN